MLAIISTVPSTRIIFQNMYKIPYDHTYMCVCVYIYVYIYIYIVKNVICEWN